MRNLSIHTSWWWHRLQLHCRKGPALVCKKLNIL